MQSSENLSILNEDAQYTRFFRGIRPTIDILEQELGSDNCRSKKDLNIEENKLYGLIEKADFEKVLDSYEQQNNDKESLEDCIETPITHDSCSYKNFAQLLYSRPAFHNPSSTDYLIKDLKIIDAQRLSLLGHSFGISNLRVDEEESLKELTRRRRNELIKSILVVANEYLDKKLTNKALFEIDRALNIDPENGNALFARGRYFLHLELPNYERAVDDFRTALNCRPDDKRQVEEELAETLDKQGERLMHMGKHRLALDNLVEALKLGTKNPDRTIFHRDMCMRKIELTKKQSPFGPKQEEYRK